MSNWRPVVGYEGLYEVSDAGEVRRGGRLLKPRTAKTGYPQVSLSNKTSKTFRVHRLVAEAFLPNPENKRTVNHKDGTRDNNQLSNLEWATYSENCKHGYQTLGRKPSRTGKLNYEKAEEIRELFRNGVQPKDIASKYGITTTTVWYIRTNHFWKPKDYFGIKA